MYTSLIDNTVGVFTPLHAPSAYLDSRHSFQPHSIPYSTGVNHYNLNYQSNIHGFGADELEEGSGTFSPHREIEEFLTNYALERSAYTETPYEGVKTSHLDNYPDSLRHQPLSNIATERESSYIPTRATGNGWLQSLLDLPVNPNSLDESDPISNIGNVDGVNCRDHGLCQSDTNAKREIYLDHNLQSVPLSVLGYENHHQNLGVVSTNDLCKDIQPPSTFRMLPQTQGYLQTPAAFPMFPQTEYHSQNPGILPMVPQTQDHFQTPGTFPIFPQTQDHFQTPKGLKELRRTAGAIHQGDVSEYMNHIDSHAAHMNVQPAGQSLGDNFMSLSPELHQAVHPFIYHSRKPAHNDVSGTATNQVAKSYLGSYDRDPLRYNYQQTSHDPVGESSLFQMPVENLYSGLIQDTSSFSSKPLERVKRRKLSKGHDQPSNIFSSKHSERLVVPHSMGMDYDGLKYRTLGGNLEKSTQELNSGKFSTYHELEEFLMKDDLKPPEHTEPPFQSRSGEDSHSENRYQTSSSSLGSKTSKAKQQNMSFGSDSNQDENSSSGTTRKRKESNTSSDEIDSSLQKLRAERKFLFLANWGIIEMGKIEGLSPKFVDYLDGIYNKHVQAESSKDTAQLKNLPLVQEAIHRAKALVVNPFFGSLGVASCSNEGKSFKRELMREGTAFLMDYFSKWESIPVLEIHQSHKWLPKRCGQDFSVTPKRMLEYLMGTKSRKGASLVTIYGLMSQFEGFLSLRKSMNLGFDQLRLSEKCLLMYREYNERNKKFKACNLDTIVISPEKIKILKKKSKSHTFEEDNSSLEKGPFQHILQIPTGLARRIHQYFDELEKKWCENIPKFQDQTPGNNLEASSKQKLDPQNPSTYLTPHLLTPEILIQDAIENARCKITPIFFSMLNKHHEGRMTPQSLETTFLKGWEFLHTYFSTWKDVDVLPMVPGTYHDYGNKRNYPGKGVDWSNSRIVVQEFIEGSLSTKHPLTFAMYLFHQWTNELLFENS